MPSTGRIRNSSVDHETKQRTESNKHQWMSTEHMIFSIKLDHINTFLPAAGSVEQTVRSLQFAKFEPCAPAPIYISSSFLSILQLTAYSPRSWSKQQMRIWEFRLSESSRCSVKEATFIIIKDEAILTSAQVFFSATEQLKHLETDRPTSYNCDLMFFGWENVIY